MSNRKVAAFGMALGVTVALAGCASGSSEDGADPVIWHEWDENSPAMLALLTATLVLEDGCLKSEDGLIAFPRAYGEWDAENQVLVFGGATYAPGDQITAGGGGGSITADMTVPDGCGASVGDPVWFIQSTNLG
jgi:hypothetical protein